MRTHHGEDHDLLRRVSLIDETGERRVRMAYMCVLASHKVNGVSKLHSQLLVDTIFSDFAKLFPGHFINITNGITPRRWLANANRPLSALIDKSIGTGWRKDLGELSKLKKFADKPAFLKESDLQVGKILGDGRQVDVSLGKDFGSVLALLFVVPHHIS